MLEESAPMASLLILRYREAPCQATGARIFLLRRICPKMSFESTHRFRKKLSCRQLDKTIGIGSIDLRRPSLSAPRCNTKMDSMRSDVLFTAKTFLFSVLIQVTSHKPHRTCWLTATVCRHILNTRGLYNKQNTSHIRSISHRAHGAHITVERFPTYMSLFGFPLVLNTPKN